MRHYIRLYFTTVENVNNLQTYSTIYVTVCIIVNPTFHKVANTLICMEYLVIDSLK